VHVSVAGNGPAIVVFPRDQGHAPRTPEFIRQSAATNTIYFPWLAGFHGGEPSEWDWMTSVRDLAIVHHRMLDALGLERPALIGLGFGGWLAAEIATMSPRSLRALVLVSPMGMKPHEAYIYDQFLVSTERYAQTALRDKALFEQVYGSETTFEQLEAWETDREMTSRIAWKPYMYNPVLAELLSGIEIPTLIVHGEDDQIVPAECAQRYKGAIAGSRLELLPESGHAVEFDQPDALTRAIATFLA
jgi:pimeloyl-ACP methyl ester carboxylesterase